MVEFFGAHEFALLKPDALKPLSTLDKCPNKSVSDRVGLRLVGLACAGCQLDSAFWMSSFCIPGYHLTISSYGIMYYVIFDVYTS